MKLLFTTVCAALTLLAQAETWNVEVGGGGLNGTPYYAPQNLTINQGDEVVWTWVSGQHNVTQTSGPVFFASGTFSAPNTFAFIFETPGTYEYECTVGNHAATQFGTIVVNPANNIARAEARVVDFTLFPNPASEVTTIEIEGQGLAVVSILDLTGKLAVRAMTIPAGAQPLDISMLSPGVYFVEVKGEASVIRKRLTVR
jgi:plastocyanin